MEKHRQSTNKGSHWDAPGLRNKNTTNQHENKNECSKCLKVITTRSLASLSEKNKISIPWNQTGKGINVNRWQQCQSGHGGRWQKTGELMTLRKDPHHPHWLYGIRHQALKIQLMWHSDICLHLKMCGQKFWLTAVIYGWWPDSV